MKNQAELKSSGAFIGSSFPTRGYKVLQDHLNTNETIELITSGSENKEVGAFAVTSKRVVFGSKKMISGSVFKDFEIDKISSVSVESGFLSSKLRITGSSGYLEIDHLGKNEARQLLDLIKSKTSKSTKAASSNDLDNLEKLAELKSKGVITEEEFTAKKKSVLGI